MAEEFSIIDYRGATYREFMFETRNPLVLLAVFIAKHSGGNFPGSTDDVPVPSLVPYAGDILPEELQERLAPLEAEFLAQGFGDPIYHLLIDPVNNTTTAMISWLHPSGVIGRAHLRLQTRFQPPRQKLFAEIISPLRDGGFLWTLSGKPDTLTPGNIVLQRDINASPAALLALHKQRAAQLQTVPVQHARARDAMLDRLQKTLFDFHTARGMFRMPSETELTRTRRGQELQATKPDGTAWKYPAALQEIENLQQKKSSWTSALWLLLISMGLFMFMGRGLWKWEDYLYLVPILFFHELGHYLTMRLFGYKNLKMFFIPFLGAAVTGKNYNVAAWKQAVVFLMGPLPGIAVGIVLGIVGMVNHNNSMLNIASMAIVINGFNLLPIMPLDGGRVMHLLLFSRHPVVDVVFRGLAIGLLMLAGVALGWSMFVLGFLMLGGLSQAWRMAKVTQELRQSNVALPAGGQTLPPELAEPILERLTAANPKVQSPRVLATQALSVFENLNARPPGWLPTLSLLAVHGSAFVLALVAGIVFLAVQAPAFKSLMREVGGAPRHAVPAEGAQHVAPMDGGDPLGPHISIITTLPDAKSLRVLRTTWNERLKPTATTTFGDTFAITVVPEQTVWADETFQLLKKLYEDVYIEDADHDTMLDLEGTAKDQISAQEIVAELQDYLNVAGLSPSMAAPWSAGDGITPEQYAQCRVTRQTYNKILNILGNAYRREPEMAALYAQRDAAERKDDKAGVTDALTKIRVAYLKLQRADLVKLQEEKTLDHTFISDYLDIPLTEKELPELSVKMLVRLGLLADAPPTQASARLARSGWVTDTDSNLMISLQVPHFVRAAPAITRWLQDRGVTHLTYSLSSEEVARHKPSFTTSAPAAGG